MSAVRAPVWPGTHRIPEFAAPEFMNGEVLPLQLEEAEARNPAALQLIEQRRATDPPRQAVVPKGGVMLRDGRGWHRVRL